MKENFLEIKNLCKSFGVTKANVNINFSLKKGEIRGLAGENGSGKSTLLSQIAGIYGSDSGEMTLAGVPYKPGSPIEANERKVAMVVQELGLVGNLPAGVNVFLGKTRQFSRFGIINTKKIYDAANAELEKWHIPKQPFHKMTGEMNVEARKMIELARALANDPEILILDEVTQALSYDNRKVLYDLVATYKKMGRSIILITHDLEEMVEICDSISILRDGQLVETIQTDTLTPDLLKTKMVGRELTGEYYRTDTKESYEDEVVLKIENISTETGLKNVSFNVHKGEILSFCGLSDSGIHEVAKAVYGVQKTESGKVTLVPDQIEIKNPMQSLQHRMAYVPKDRDGEALMMNSTIKNNFCLSSIENISGKAGFLDGKKMAKMAITAKNEYGVKAISIEQTMNALSGGNKQKVNLGRWLLKDLQAMVICCPTRGVDVGVKSYIYDCLREAKKKGIAILMITDELPEAIGMADRIIIMKNGEIKKTITRSEGFSEEEIIEVMV